MVRDRFYRQLNGSVYLFGAFTHGDLSFIMLTLTANMVTVESVWLFFWSLVALPLYVLALRAGRPPGYDRHLFVALLSPSLRRAGRSDVPMPRMRLGKRGGEHA